MVLFHLLSLSLLILIFLYPLEIHSWSIIFFFVIPFIFLTKKEISIPKPSVLLSFFLITLILESLLNRFTYFSLIPLSYGVLLMVFYTFTLQIERLNLLKFTVFASLPAIFYGFYQKFFLFSGYLRKTEELKGLPFLMKARLVERLKEGRVFSLFSLPTSFCFFLSVISLISLGLALRERKKKEKIFYFSISILSSILMIFTKSFGGILGLSGGFFIFLFLMGRRDFRILMIALIISIAVISTIFYLRVDTLSTKNPLTLRISNWKIAIKVISEHFLFGVGLNNYTSFSLPFARERAEATKYAHNFFLQFFAETGVLCFVLLLLVLFQWLYKVLKEIGEDPLEASVWGGLFSLLLYNLIDIGVYFESFGFLTAILLSSVNRNFENFIIQNRKKFFFTLIFFILLLFPLWTYVTEEFIDVANMSIGNDILYAEKNLKLAKKINPFNPKVYSYLSFIESEKGDLQLSLEYIEKSNSLYPYSHSLHFERAKILLKMGRYLEAYFSLREAEKLNPAFIPYRDERKKLEDFLFRGKND